MGEQGALPIPGFDFDNSPLALLKAKDRIQGRSVVHTTSNGTKLVKLLMSLGGVVLAGSFLNLSACVSKAAELLSNGGLPAPDPARAARGNISDGRKLADSGTGIVVACAGRRGMPILDDTYFAGAFVKRLRALLPDAEVGDGALIAQTVNQALPVDLAFRESESGLVMAELGLQEEISFCARAHVQPVRSAGEHRGGTSGDKLRRT